MESKSQGKFAYLRQSSMAPEREMTPLSPEFNPSKIEEGVRLMFLANEGDLDGINEILDSGIDVNFKDIDSRTPLHIAACQGLTNVVELLLQRGAEVDPKDRWGSTPLADAIYYKNQEVIDLLENHGAKPPMTPTHLQNSHEIPEYEFDPSELEFSNNNDIIKGTYRIASWRGIEVVVKGLGDDVAMDEDKVKAFKDELTLLQKLRHPNVVQFLGAVTQSSPMMIITEYLHKGDLRTFLNRKGALKPLTTVKFALDIARGMSYLHENSPAIIHRHLEPPNILRDDSGHLKVTDFDLRKLLNVSKTVKEHGPVSCQETSWRYVAPELFKKEEYDTKVDVFSFALIIQEMIEGCPPFMTMGEEEAAKAYCSNERPPFTAPAKYYALGLKELIEYCWNDKPVKRPTFRQIIIKLEEIEKVLDRKRRLKAGPCGCFRFFKKLGKSKPIDSGSHSSTSIVR